MDECAHPEAPPTLPPPLRPSEEPVIARKLTPPMRTARTPRGRRHDSAGITYADPTGEDAAHNVDRNRGRRRRTDRRWMRELEATSRR